MLCLRVSCSVARCALSPQPAGDTATTRLLCIRVLGLAPYARICAGRKSQIHIHGYSTGEGDQRRSINKSVNQSINQCKAARPVTTNWPRESERLTGAARARQRRQHCCSVSWRPGTSSQQAVERRRQGSGPGMVRCNWGGPAASLVAGRAGKAPRFHGWAISRHRSAEVVPTQPMSMPTQTTQPLSTWPLCHCSRRLGRAMPAGANTPLRPVPKRIGVLASRGADLLSLTL